MLKRKMSLFILILSVTAVMQGCADSTNGDRAKGGEPDTVGNRSNIRIKDSTNGTKDTLKHP
jgi:uncharacterized protein YceK